MKSRKISKTIVILDCSREFVTSDTPGLDTPEESPEHMATRHIKDMMGCGETLIAYACGPNETTTDGKRAHRASEIERVA